MGLLLSDDLHHPLSLSILIMGILLLLALPNAEGQDYLQSCSTTAGSYAANSTYGVNLKALLTSLATNGPATGFFQDRVGSNTTSSDLLVHGYVICGYDVDGASCRDCKRRLGTQVLLLCENSKAADITTSGCQLSYSNGPLPSSTPADPLSSACTSLTIAIKVDLFYEQLGKMMDRLIQYAAYNSSSSSGHMFATGEVNYDKSKIYGLVQCTENQTSEACDRCLRGTFDALRSKCQGPGGSAILSTCYITYDIVPVYRGSALLTIDSPAGVPPEPSVLPPSANPTMGGNQKKVRGTLLVIVICSGIALVLICVTSICFWKKNAAKKTYYTGEITNVNSLLFDLSTLKVATCNFSDVNKLGEGGFGSVYKGLLADGQEIAVKKLSASSGQGLEELKNELFLLAKQEHRNLIRLLGVCFEQDNLLVYEYMPNKSLDSILFDPYKHRPLNWEIRYKIIEGIARGLLYLHEESQYKVIHRDLKASNILLDANMNPKISDFGISRLFGGDQTHAITNRVVGTFGYMAPEYIIQGQFSNKSDVFSFGVLVLEIVTGLRNSSFSDSESSIDLPSYVRQHLTNGTAFIVDPSLDGRYHRTEVLTCIQVGLLCVQEAPTNRPTISSVVLMLESRSITQGVSLQLESNSPVRNNDLSGDAPG